MREQAYGCLQEKIHVLNRFRALFVSQERSEDDQATCAGNFLDDIDDGTGMAYNGKLDYEPDEIERI
jgi:hypothetical protein